MTLPPCHYEVFEIENPWSIAENRLNESICKQRGFDPGGKIEFYVLNLLMDVMVL